MDAISHVDYWGIQAHIQCTHTHICTHATHTHTHALTHTHRAQMSVTSKPVNLDGWNFSCELLRHTDTYNALIHTFALTQCTHTHTHTHTHALTHTHRAQMSVTSKPVNLDGWNFSCGLLRHTGTHTMHSHTHLHSRNAHTHTHALTHTHRAQMSVTSKLVNLDGWNFSCELLRHTDTYNALTHTFALTQCTHTHSQSSNVTSKPVQLKCL